MLFVPLQFVVAMLLLVLFAAVVRREDGGRANRPFLALILLSAVQSVLSGLRWGYGIDEFRLLMPLGAACVPPLAYLGVARLVRKSRTSTAARLGWHALPAVVVAVLVAVAPVAIDGALIAIFVGYAGAILLLMRDGTDALRMAPFEGAEPAYRAVLFAAMGLLLSASIDLFVALDLAWTEGEAALKAITVGNLGALLILATAAGAASRSHAPAESVDSVPGPKPQAGSVDSVPEPEPPADSGTMAALEALMAERHVYRDIDLNLDRLSRKLAIPARQISTAINRAAGKNVSQYVNEYRIAEACALLEGTERPVTEIMFEVGFQTKSNFNREFRRVTDMTPLAWRQRANRAP